MSAVATVFADGAALQGSKTPFDIVVNNIQSVEWEECGWSRMVLNEQDTPMYLAELTANNPNKSDYFTDIVDSYSVFPTYSPKPNEQALSQARVKIQLQLLVPDGMDATVHYCWFDPKDPDDYNQQNFTPRTKNWQVSQQGDGNLLKDNKIGLGVQCYPYSYQVVHFCKSPFGSALPLYTNTQIRKVIVSFANGSFGDNFIVAVHPNIGVAAQYCFQNDGKTLKRPGSNNAIPASMRTSVLYVAAWNGFKVPKTWLYDEEAYTIATEKLDTIEDATGVLLNGRANGESYAKSVLKFDTGFDFTLAYQFDRTRATPQSPYLDGYVKPTKQNPKLSFVANSGVKLGSTESSQFTGTTYEVAILDVVSMINNVTAAPGKTKLQTFVDAVKEKNYPNHNLTEIPVVNGLDSRTPKDTLSQPAVMLKFSEERLGQLMHGVKYDLLLPEYSNINGFNAITQTGIAKYKEAFQQHYNSLVNVVGNQTMTVTWRTTGNLKVSVNSVNNYFQDNNVASIGDGHLYLQSHWGSGVVFTSASLQLN